MEQSNKQLALELHFSSLVAPSSLYCVALEKSYSSVGQIVFADWQEACRRDYLEKYYWRPQTDWNKWQASLAKAYQFSARCSAEEVLIYGTKEYPQQLYHLHRAPFVLFASGKLPEWSEFSGFAVCGSRKASLQGRRNAFVLAYAVSKQSQFRLVSGLSEGIELSACRGALETGTESLVGVLCSGLDAIAPAESQKMAQRILQSGGLLLSEYPSWQPRQSFAFLQRNRILAALAASLVMVELNPKSKAFNLVEYALELNHDVACLGESVGVQRLREQGCAHWEDALALLENLNMELEPAGQDIAENMRAELSGMLHEYLGFKFRDP